MDIPTFRLGLQRWSKHQSYKAYALRARKEKIFKTLRKGGSYAKIDVQLWECWATYMSPLAHRAE